MNTAQKRKFPIKGFLGKCSQNGRIYWRDPYWKTSFLCTGNSCFQSPSFYPRNLCRVFVRGFYFYRKTYQFTSLNAIKNLKKKLNFTQAVICRWCLKTYILRIGEAFTANLSALTILSELLGAIGSFLQLIMLMLCVVAIWAPVSPSILKPSNCYAQNNASILPENSALSNKTVTTQAPHLQQLL